MKGKIIFEQDVPFEDINSRHLVAEVSRKTPRTFGSGDLTILAIDCGALPFKVYCCRHALSLIPL
jgi:hypothetical protein